jgi:putative FmdB family regulatory protein
MPLYNYQCYECGKVQEEMRSVKDRDKSIACDHCMCASDRIIDLAAFQLKGGGWAKDGYVKKQKPKEKKKEKKKE